MGGNQVLSQGFSDEIYLKGLSIRDQIAKSFENRLYKFYSDLNLAMTNFLRIFDGDIRTTIDSLTFDIPKPINESRMSRLAIRTTVKDIVNVLKNGEEGFFMLPNEDGGEYSFINLPFEYGVELTLEIDDEMDGYKIDGEYSYEPDDTISVIELSIKYNPKTLRKNFYNIIGELNDILPFLVSISLSETNLQVWVTLSLWFFISTVDNILTSLVANWALSITSEVLIFSFSDEILFKRYQVIHKFCG